MFVYSFTNYAWHDRIFHTAAKIPKKQVAGDLLWVNEQYWLLLWDDISFIEQYKTKRNTERTVIEHYPKFFSLQTQELIHRMVYQWFTTYKKIIPLFISNDIDYLISKHSPKKKVILDSRSALIFNNEKNRFIIETKKPENTKEIWQQLITFPDLRSLYNMININSLPEDVVILTSQTSANQKAKIFWGIKYNKITTLLTTHSWIFQERSNLKEIILVHPNRWYYTNQKDPRYKTEEILKKMAEIYWSEVSFIE